MTQPWTIDDHLAHLTALYGWKMQIVPCEGTRHPAYDILHGGGRRDHASTLQGAVTIALATHESHQARYHRHGRGDVNHHPPLIHDELGVRVLPRWPRIPELRLWAAIGRLDPDAPIRPVHRDVPAMPDSLTTEIRPYRPDPTKPGA